MSARFIRLFDREGAPIAFTLDGAPAEARAGDTVLTAVLANRRDVGPSDCGDHARAGFCLMGSCQGCWVYAQDGARLRACTTPLEAGMVVTTRWSPNHG
jgi:predicted molibdopterin-dependent oxidoreductase YjgC